MCSTPEAVLLLLCDVRVWVRSGSRRRYSLNESPGHVLQHLPGSKIGSSHVGLGHSFLMFRHWTRATILRFFCTYFGEEKEKFEICHDKYLTRGISPRISRLSRFGCEKKTTVLNICLYRLCARSLFSRRAVPQNGKPIRRQKMCLTNSFKKPHRANICNESVCRKLTRCWKQLSAIYSNVLACLHRRWSRTHFCLPFRRRSVGTEFTLSRGEKDTKFQAVLTGTHSHLMQYIFPNGAPRSGNHVEPSSFSSLPKWHSAKEKRKEEEKYYSIVQHQKTTFLSNQFVLEVSPKMYRF